MKHHERRTLGNGTFTYYKLATWDARSFTYRDGKVAYDTLQDATNAARKPGTYRVSVVTPDGRTDMQPFTV